MFKFLLEPEKSMSDIELEFDRVYWYPLQIDNGIMGCIGIACGYDEMSLQKMKEYALRKRRIMSIHKINDNGDFLFITVGPNLRNMNVFGLWPFRTCNGPYLFNLSIDYRKYLKIGEINEQLKEIFKYNNIRLSNGTRVCRIGNKSWKIKGQEGGYIIEEANDQLNVYKKQLICYISSSSLKDNWAGDVGLRNYLKELGWSIKESHEIDFKNCEFHTECIGLNILSHILALSIKDKRDGKKRWQQSILQVALTHGFLSEWKNISEYVNKGRVIDVCKELSPRNVDEQSLDNTLKSLLINKIDKNSDIFNLLYALSRGIDIHASPYILANMFDFIPDTIRKKIKHTPFKPKLIIDEIEIHFKVDASPENIKDVVEKLREITNEIKYLEIMSIEGLQYRLIGVFKIETDYPDLLNMLELIDKGINEKLEEMGLHTNKWLMWLKRINITTKTPSQFEDAVLDAIGKKWPLIVKSIDESDNELKINADLLCDYPLYKIDENYLFSLEPEYKQYLKEKKVNKKLIEVFEDNDYFLFKDTKISKIDLISWEIKTGVSSYKIKDRGKQLDVYYTGIEEGIEEGIQEGIEEGIQEGTEEGIQEGIEEGIQEGTEEGIQGGIEEGIQEGTEEGIQGGIEEGIQEGIEEGIQEGIEEGIQEGIEEGIQEGIEEGIQENVKYQFMLPEKLTIDIAYSFTYLNNILKERYNFDPFDPPAQKHSPENSSKN
ncbi:hypothetical protein BEH94_09960 [Candidatus Altiarchaeales archaeon WOR_SM1_SCG]|nr:hypothetical protein BEH94_09960 [Candidatus Altiarchaeales archaeon WOR_SM1_SCG]